MVMQSLQWLRRHDQAAVGYLLMSPLMLQILVFTAYPVAYSLWLSLQQASGFGGDEQFIGLANYRQLLGSPEFGKVIQVTAYFVFGSVPIRIVVGLGLALLLDQRLRARTLYRSLVYSPVVTSTVAVAIIWIWIFDPGWGLLNYVGAFAGVKPIPWLGSPQWAMPAVIIVAVWKGVGFNMLLYLAGLQGIPTHFHEAAKVDGANSAARFFFITWPLLLPTTFFILVTEIISSSQVFDLVYVMTHGGPVQSTTVIIYYLYQYAFQYFKLGYASAVAWVLFAFILVLTLLQWFAFPGRDQTVD
jgi:multiple sugar transport system permease protein